MLYVENTEVEIEIEENCYAKLSIIALEKQKTSNQLAECLFQAYLQES